jgi:pimeloyl-ACP methyl ester carboxylesterase
MSLPFSRGRGTWRGDSDLPDAARAVASDAFTLPDGRRLRWHEFGAPGGAAVIFTAGTPLSGLGGAFYDEAARAAGLRWISPDKPGYGGSDYQRNRSLDGWAEDVAALAGHLGLERFALAGESGGGPFALAAARVLARRVSVVALIASAGLRDPAERANLRARLRVMFWLAGNAPTFNAVPVAAIRRELLNPARRERSLQRELAVTPEAGHAALRMQYAAVADALRPGIRATLQETALITRLRAFPLDEVTPPVHLWHGALDRDVPIAYALRLARDLPDATLHVSDSSGHDVGRDRAGEIMSVLAFYATRSPGSRPRP